MNYQILAWKRKDLSLKKGAKDSTMNGDVFYVYGKAK